ncbi:hypothetical protein EMCG_03614 [[Emmonsia] crescens]|uniref:Uncharacterized protein n=1 Tax=[Emmonsia] crescens TaxID=73230 RepID=A0A0G2HVY8_9EURO|nr:hypothetical protein EMCG_03614 [Emmonsia crescens UAMH 3008]
MSSLFSSKSKPQRSSLSSKKNEEDDLSTGCCGSGSKSTFSKMRKRRPPPINISLGDANIFISAMNPCSDILWSPVSPHIHPPPGCGSRTCGKKKSAMLMSPPLSPCFCCQRFWPTPAGPSHHPQTPTTQCFSIAAELPGSVVRPVESVELDVPSTPIRKPLEHGEARIMGSTPGLMCSPGWDNDSRVFGSDLLEPQNRRSNTKLCSDMDFWALLEALPSLSADDIKEHWHPAMVEQTRRMGNGNLKLENEVRDDAANTREELYTLMDLETIKQHCEEQLNAKETEITELRQLHESRLNVLCTFISKHTGPELAQSTDPELSEALTDILRNQNQQHPDKLLPTPNKDHTKRTQEQSRFRSQSYPQEPQTSLSRMPRTEHGHRNTTFMNNPKTDRNASSRDNNLALTIKLKQYEAATRHLKQDIQEKDTQIAVLNRKVTQLLNMGSPTTITSSSSSSSSSKGTEADAPTVSLRPNYTLGIEKDLPLLPGPPRRSRCSDSNLYLKQAPGNRRKISSTATRMTMAGATRDTRFSLGSSMGTEARPGPNILDVVYRPEVLTGEGFFF